MNSLKRGSVGVAALLCACGMASAGGSPPIQAIYTKVAGSPTEVVPGAVDGAGMPAVTTFRQFFQFTISPDGSMWALRASNQLGADFENIVLMGSGTTGTKFLQESEAMPAGSVGELVDFFGSGFGRFNDANDFAFSLRARGASTLQKVLSWSSGGGFVAEYQQGSLYTGLADTGATGDEAVGNSVGSIHILNDGRIGSQDSTVTGIATARRPVTAYDLAGFRQSNVSIVTGLGGVGTETVSGISANNFYTTTDGTKWGFVGDIARPTGFSNALIVNDEVIMRQQQPLPGSASTFFDGTALGAYGSEIYCRGGLGLTSATGAFAWRSDGLLVETGDEIISPPSGETWIGTSFSGFSGNRNGDWLLVGRTSAAEATNDVIVLNGESIIVREGDPVDVDGNGLFDDDCFIGHATNTSSAYTPDTMFVTDDGWLYFMANIKNGAGVGYNSSALGAANALLRVRAFVPPPLCDGDANGDNVVDAADLSVLLANFGTSTAGGAAFGDFNGDGNVDTADLSVLLGSFGNNCN